MSGSVRPLLFLLVMILVGCVQATVPPQLAYTPGSPITITDDYYYSATFSVLRPDGWRVITSAADAPHSVIFVSPDDTALIMLSTAGIGDPPRPDVDEPLRDSIREIDWGEAVLSLYSVAPQSQWEALQPIIDAVEASLQRNE